MLTIEVAVGSEWRPVGGFSGGEAVEGGVFWRRLGNAISFSTSSVCRRRQLNVTDARVAADTAGQCAASTAVAVNSTASAGAAAASEPVGQSGAASFTAIQPPPNVKGVQFGAITLVRRASRACVDDMSSAVNYNGLLLVMERKASKRGHVVVKGRGGVRISRSNVISTYVIVKCLALKFLC